MVEGNRHVKDELVAAKWGSGWRKVRYEPWWQLGFWARCSKLYADIRSFFKPLLSLFCTQTRLMSLFQIWSQLRLTHQLGPFFLKLNCKKRENITAHPTKSSSPPKQRKELANTLWSFASLKVRCEVGHNQIAHRVFIGCHFWNSSLAEKSWSFLSTYYGVVEGGHTWKFCCPRGDWVTDSRKNIIYLIYQHNNIRTHITHLYMHVFQGDVILRLVWGSISFSRHSPTVSLLMFWLLYCRRSGVRGVTGW